MYRAGGVGEVQDAAGRERRAETGNRVPGKSQRLLRREATLHDYYALISQQKANSNIDWMCQPLQLPPDPRTTLNDAEGSDPDAGQPKSWHTGGYGLPWTGWGPVLCSTVMDSLLAVLSRPASLPHPHGLSLPKWSRSIPADCPAGFTAGTPPVRRIRRLHLGSKSRARVRTVREICAHIRTQTPLTCDNNGSVGGHRSHTPRPLSRSGL